MAINLADIEALVAQFEASDWRRIELVADGIELRLCKDGTPPPATAHPPSSSPRAEPEPPPLLAGTTVTAPSLGTFYRAPKPGEQPFVEIGAHVAEGDPLCLVEVMKLFTTVHAPCAGTVRAVHASDGDLVEFGQPLLSIEPDA
jgi:acetyl-CoA carboxylase biotin carboxyl carrier protein